VVAAAVALRRGAAHGRSFGRCCRRRPLLTDDGRCGRRQGWQNGLL
jgi:hypothetical protein